MKLDRGKEEVFHLGDFAALLTFVICFIIALSDPEATNSITWWLAVGVSLFILWMSRYIKIHHEGTISHFVRFLWFLVAGVFLLLVAYNHAHRGVFYFLAGMEIVAVLALCFDRGRKAIRDFLNRISRLSRLVSFVSQLGALFYFVIMLLLSLFLPEEKRQEYRWWIYGVSVLPALIFIIFLVRKQKKGGSKSNC